MKTKLLIKSVVGLLVLFMMASCGSSSSSDSSEKVSITFEDIKWELESYGNEESLQKVLEETNVTISFNKIAESLSGSAGCNDYGGGYSVEQENLTVSTLFSTEMYCLNPDGVMEQEQEFLALLSNAKTYQFAEEFLQIASSEGLVLIFKKTTEIEVTMEDNGTQVTLEKDGVLRVSLSSNATTGYQWEVSELNTAMLQQIGTSEYVTPEPTDPPVLGSGGTEIFRFKAISSGTSSLKLIYKRAWETEAAQIYLLEVVVN